MITVSSPNMMDLLKLSCKPRKDELEQYRELTGCEWDIDDVATDLYTRSGLKFVLLDEDEEPIVAFGMTLVLPGVWQTWMIGSQEAWEQHWKGITRNCRKIMNAVLDDPGVRRIQTMVLDSREETCKWYVKGLKMTKESVAKGFGVTGQDVACYVRFKET